MEACASISETSFSCSLFSNMSLAKVCSSVTKGAARTEGGSENLATRHKRITQRKAAGEEI